MSALKKWGPLIALVIVVIAGVYYVNRLRSRASDAEEERDRVALEAAGANAVHEVTKKELRAEMDGLASQNLALQAEIDRIRGAMPGATVVVTGSGSTGALPVLPKPPAAVPGAPTACPAPTPCLLTPDDRLDLRVAVVALQGDSGAVGVAATAQAWRVGEPAVLLAEGPVKLTIKVKDEKELPGWGAGAVVVGGRHGWWAGPLVSPPPIRVWGLEGSLIVGIGVGGDGEWGALAGGLVRW